MVNNYLRGFFLAILSVAVLAGCSSSRSPAPYVAPLTNFTPAFSVHSAWSTHVTRGTNGQYLALTPAVANGILFVDGYQGDVVAVNTDNGRRLWQAHVRVPLTTGVAVGDQSIFIGAGNGSLLAFYQNDGKLAWWAPLSGEPLAAAQTTDGLALIKSSDDHLYAFNQQTGQETWSYHQGIPDLILRSGSKVQVSGGNAIVGFASGEVGVFRLSNGNLAWKQPVAQPSGATAIERMVDIDHSLAVMDNMIYAATYQGSIAAIDSNTGTMRWSQAISSYAGLVVDENNVYVTAADSTVWAFNRATGKVVWHQQGLMGRGLTAPALMVNAIVMADASGYVHWLSRQDGQFWHVLQWVRVA